MQLNESPIYSTSYESAIDRHPLTVHPQTSLVRAIALMSQTQSSCVLVVEGTGQMPTLLGIFTERDVLHLAATGGLRRHRRSKIAQVMNAVAIAISPTEAQDISKIYQLLSQHRILHLPVVDGQRRLVGLITQESLLRELSFSEARSNKATKNSLLSEGLSPLPTVDSLSSKAQQMSTNGSASEAARFRFLIQHRLLDIINPEYPEIVKARLRQKQEQDKSRKQFASDRARNDSQTIDVEIASELISLQSSLLDRVRSAVIATDAEGKIIYWNKFAEHLYQWTAAEVIGKSAFKEVLCPATNKSIIPEIFNSLVQKGLWEGECVVQRKDGSNFVALVKESVIKNKQGKVTGMVGVSVDITDRLSAEVALRQSEEQWRLLVETMNEGLVACNVDGAIAYANQKLSVMLGYAPSELIGIQCWQFVAKNQQHIVQKQIAKCREGQSSSGEVELTRKNGMKLYAIVSTTPIQDSHGSFQGWFSAIADITDRVRSQEELEKYRDRLETLVQVRTSEKTKVIASLEKANEQLQQEIVYRKLAVTSLRESERLIQRINDTSPHIVYLYDRLQHRNIYVNRQFTQLLGYSPELLQTQGINFLLDKLHPDDRGVLKQFRQQLTTAKDGDVIESEYRIKHATGEWRWIHSRNVVFIRDSDGKPQQILGTAADITGRKQTEEALRQREERYRAFVGQSSEAIYRIEFEPPVSVLEPEDKQNQQIFQNGYLAECNDVMAKKYGFESASEIVGVSFGEIVTNSDAHNIEQVQNFIRSGYRIDRSESHEIDATGNRKYFLNNLVGIVENGKLVRMWGTQLDITAQQQAQQALSSSEARYRLLAENATDMISRHSPEGVFLYVSPASRNLLGMEPQEMVGYSSYDFCHPDDVEAIATTYEALLQQPGVHTVSYRIGSKNKHSSPCFSPTIPSEGENSLNNQTNGDYIWFETTARTVSNPQTGAVVEIIAVSRNITRRKLAEEALQKSEERLTSILNSLQDVVWSIDATTDELLYLNPIASAVYGRPMSELLTNRHLWLEMIHPDDRQRVQQFFQIFLKTGLQEIEYRIVRPNGEVRWLRDRAWLVCDSTGKAIRIDGLATDITERISSDRALRESEERFRQLAASVDQVFWIASIDMNQILYISPAYQTISGRTCESLYEQPNAWFEIIHPADRHRVKMAIARQIRPYSPEATVTGVASTSSLTNPPSFNEEFRIIQPDGKSRWLWVRSFLIANEGGEIYRRTGVAVDISDRKQMEEALLVTQQHLQYLLSSSPAVIYSAIASGFPATKFISENVTALLGYQPREFTENPNFLRDRIHPEDVERVLAKVPKLLQQERHTDDYRILHFDGTYRWMRDEIRLIRDATGNPVELVGYWADITTQKAAEEEISKALAKEKELSQLRSRFITLTSHEFRTPLCTILSSADLLEFYIEQASAPISAGWRGETNSQSDRPLSKLLEHIKRIQTASVHMTGMLNDILAIGSCQANTLACNPAPIDLENFCRQLVEEIVAGVTLTPAPGAQKAASIGFVCRCTCTDAVMDEKLLRHILGNLLSNAIKYSPSGSTVDFELICPSGTDCCEGGTQNHAIQPFSSSLPSTKVAIFRIQDTGIGIPHEDRERIFDSFYRGGNVSNKAGTGLGLAIVKKAVEVHGGQIVLESEVGVGTTFTVMLPLNAHQHPSAITENDISQQLYPLFA